MKIDMRLGDGRRIDARKFTGSLTAKWLHGAPADGAKVTLQAQLRQIPTRFKGYEKYSFDDATKYFETEEREIVSGTTDQQGTLQLTTGGLASLEGLSPGMLSGKFTVKVFEKSGDFSVDQQIIPVSPYDAYFGIGVTPQTSDWGDEYLDSKKEHLLRIAKFTRGEATSFFVFNEAPNAVQETLSLPVSGKYIAADLLNGVYTRGETADGTVGLALEAGQSVILIFGGATEDEWAGFPEKSEGLHMAEIETLWDIDLRETGKETEFKPFRKNSKLFNITGKNGETEFSGEMRYKTKLNINDTAHVELEFENVGVTAQLFVNGKDMGQRICRPYRWDITEAVKAGENDVEVFVCNTLAQRMQDFFSTYMTLPASGITGKVRLFVQ